MLFRTRYGTKVTIQSEPIAKNHIEPYSPSPINANLMINELEDNGVESQTPIEGIPDILLDEWVVQDQIQDVAALVE